jgi:hypothetical protein
MTGPLLRDILWNDFYGAKSALALLEARENTFPWSYSYKVEFYFSSSLGCTD